MPERSLQFCPLRCREEWPRQAAVLLQRLRQVVQEPALGDRPQAHLLRQRAVDTLPHVSEEVLPSVRPQRAHPLLPPPGRPADLLRHMISVSTVQII